jgi:hypothetical protein
MKVKLAKALRTAVSSIEAVISTRLRMDLVSGLGLR